MGMHIIALLIQNTTQTHSGTHMLTVSAWANSYWGESCLQFTPGANQGYIVLRKKVSDYVCHPNEHMTPGEWPPQAHSLSHCVAHFGFQLREWAGSVTGHRGAPFPKYLAITDWKVTEAFVFGLQETAISLKRESSLLTI